MITVLKSEHKKLLLYIFVIEVTCQKPFERKTNSSYCMVYQALSRIWAHILLVMKHALYHFATTTVYLSFEEERSLFKLAPLFGLVFELHLRFRFSFCFCCFASEALKAEKIEDMTEGLEWKKGQQSFFISLDFRFFRFFCSSSFRRLLLFPFLLVRWLLIFFARLLSSLVTNYISGVPCFGFLWETQSKVLFAWGLGSRIVTLSR